MMMMLYQLGVKFINFLILIWVVFFGNVLIFFSSFQSVIYWNLDIFVVYFIEALVISLFWSMLLITALTDAELIWKFTNIYLYWKNLFN